MFKTIIKLFDRLSLKQKEVLSVTAINVPPPSPTHQWQSLLTQFNNRLPPSFPPPLAPIPPLPSIPMAASSYQVLVSNPPHSAVLGALVENIFHINASGPILVHKDNKDSLKISFGDSMMGYGTIVNLDIDSQEIPQLICDLAETIDRDSIPPALADALDNLQIVSRLSR